MDLASLQRWLDRYVEAWNSRDPEAIGALFAADAIYFFDPFDSHPARGREAIIAEWLELPEEAGTFECRWEALAVNADLGVGAGWTRYQRSNQRPGREYRNVLVLRFDDDGQCVEFTEWATSPAESRTQLPLQS